MPLTQEMKEMDCETCEHATILGPGTYRTVNGNVAVVSGKSYTCTNKTIRNMTIVGNKMYCSDYKEKKA